MNEMRQKLESDLAQHSTAILDIKRRLNSLTCVACLPPELLCKIFLFHTFSHYATRDALQGAYPPFQPYQWIAVAQVCHYWRSAALAVPFLWSTIWLNNVDWIKELLSRSKNTPLTVWSTDNCIQLESFKLVMAELPRIKGFHVESRWLPRELEDSMSMLLARSYAKSAPGLEQLSFRSAMSWQRYPSHASDHTCDYRLDSIFSGCQLPSLRQLEIKSYDKRWTNLLLRPTLTHLTLSSKHFLYTPHLRETLAALAAMPLLEELDLTRVFSGYPDESDIDNPKFRLESAHLPLLHKLRLSHNAIACSLLLRHISAPVLATVVLDCSLHAKPNSPSPSPLVQLRELRSALDDRVRACAPDGPCSLSMQLPFINSTGIFEFQLWAGHQPALSLLQDEDVQPSLPSPFIDVHLTFDYHAQRGIRNPVLEICSSDWVSRVTSCHVDLIDFDQSMGDALVDILERSTELTELSVGQWTKGYLCNVLAPEGAERVGTPPLLPHLSKLALRGISIRPSPPHHHHRVSRSEETADAGFLTGLKEVMQRRVNADAKLETLVLWECTNVSHDDVDMLASTVGSVDWDGVFRPGNARALSALEVLTSDDED